MPREKSCPQDPPVLPVAHGKVVLGLFEPHFFITEMRTLKNRLPNSEGQCEDYAREREATQRGVKSRDPGATLPGCKPARALAGT